MVKTHSQIRFLLVGNKFMPEMHLRQPGFTQNVCGPFITNKQRIRNLKDTRDSSYICQNKLDKACFEHDLAYRDFQHLAKRTTTDKALHDKAYENAHSLQYDGYQEGLLQRLI